MKIILCIIYDDNENDTQRIRKFNYIHIKDDTILFLNSNKTHLLGKRMAE